MDGKWGEYEGRALGNWQLDSLLGVRGDTAFYLSRNTAPEDDRLIELVPAGAATVASWNRARDVPSEDLVRVHATGSGDLYGTAVSYAVMDLPDDDLGEILTRHALDETDALAIFSAVAGALAALHRRGLAHGAISPSNIFMVRDAVRLSVDTLSPAGNRDKEQDLRQFGATLVKAMTGCADEDLVDGPAIARAAARLPAPFRQVALGAVGGSSHGKWTAARIVETLSGHPLETTRATRVSWPLVGGAGIGVAVLLLYLFFHGSPPRPAPTKPAAEVSTARPQLAKPSALEPRHAPAVPVAVKPNGERKTTGESWAVIAGTYAQFEAAQKHADIYGKQLPQLHLHVFPRDGQGKHYLIVLASGLTQEAAESLRREVIEQGAPRDTYVTKIADN